MQPLDPADLAYVDLLVEACDPIVALANEVAHMREMRDAAKAGDFSTAWVCDEVLRRKPGAHPIRTNGGSYPPRV